VDIDNGPPVGDGYEGEEVEDPEAELGMSPRGRIGEWEFNMPYVRGCGLGDDKS
jgi:hypothetical protein